jgi:hypothetical protein
MTLHDEILCERLTHWHLETSQEYHSSSKYHSPGVSTVFSLVNYCKKNWKVLIFMGTLC